MSELLITKKQDLQNIANKLKTKIGKTDEMSFPNGFMEAIDDINGATSQKLQDKTVTENGTYTADSGYDGLGSVTVEVESGLEGLENGYDIMFYDDNNEELAFYSIKQGHSTNAPIYNCKAWKTEDGVSLEFPITPTEDMSIFANNDTYAKQLYDFYGVDSAIYPCVAISISPTYSGSSSYYYQLVFAKSINANVSSNISFNDRMSSVVQIYGLNVDITNIQEVINYIMKNISSFDGGNDSIYNKTEAIYTNFDLPFTPTKTFLRLDE